jgi:hypothetical protein
VAVTYRPSDGYSWEQAKFGFRSSIFVLVTFVDHLFMLHMQTSELVRDSPNRTVPLRFPTLK